MGLPDWIAVGALIGFLVGGVVGFLIGVDAAAGAFAKRWLELHPEDADVQLRADDGPRLGRF